METKSNDTPQIALYLKKNHPNVFNIWFNEHQINLMKKLELFLTGKELKKERELIFMPRGSGATSILEYYRKWLGELDFYCEIEIKEHHSNVPHGCIIEIINRLNIINLKG